MRKYVYIWLPCALLAYLVFMALTYKDELLATGHSVRFYLTLGIELAIIIALAFFLRRRGTLRRRREQEDRRLEQERNRKSDDSMSVD